MTEGKSVAADFALDCLARAELAEEEHATRGAAPDAQLEVAKAQVYAILAVVEALEGADGPVFGRD